MFKNEEIDDGPIWSKPHKVCCCHSFCFPCNFLFHPCRKAVSGKKVRWEKEGFSLDLTYVDKRIIVHGFPSAGLEHIYRNPRQEIRRFMDAKHKNHYKMYNFCCEPGRGYDHKIFYDRVEVSRLSYFIYVVEENFDIYVQQQINRDTPLKTIILLLWKQWSLSETVFKLGCNKTQKMLLICTARLAKAGLG